MTWDLNRIIARKRYRVNLPPEEMFDKIEEFLCPSPLLPDCKEWYIDIEGDRYRRFVLNPAYSFIASHSKLNSTFEERRKLLKNFLKNAEKIADEFLENLRSNIPYQLDIMVLKVNEFGCICQAECRPVLYMKLSKGMISMSDVTEFQIQDASIESSNFLDQVFIGGLGAEPVQEAPKITHKSEFLVNNANTREITERIESLLDEATGEVLICGWIGTYFIPKLIELKNKGVTIRFITHKPQEARNQPWRGEIEEAFKKLCSHIGLENICIDPTMHGRMIIVDNKALIGSMDLNAYSLTGPHTEFAIYTDDPEIVRKLRNLFYTKFKPLKEE